MGLTLAQIAINTITTTIIAIIMGTRIILMTRRVISPRSSWLIALNSVTGTLN
jgi:hypothetical protein